jgi:hypothetical protein
LDEMPLPVLLTIAYLAINLALLVWLERERAQGRPPAQRVATLALALRFGPPLIGFAYLVTIAGDWLFFLFVAAFFAIGFWLLDGLLAFTIPPRRSDTMRKGWDDRGAGTPSNPDRERS